MGCKSVKNIHSVQRRDVLLARNGKFVTNVFRGNSCKFRVCILDMCEVYLGQNRSGKCTRDTELTC